MIAVTTNPVTGFVDVGQTVTFTLTLNAAVKVSGAVVLTLNDGGTASYTGGPSSTTTLTFSTTVAAGQNTSALAITGVSIPANGYIFAAASGHGIPANLAGAVKSFPALSVNTSAPTVTALTASPPTPRSRRARPSP